MTAKEKITEILKAYTKKHNIMASVVILEEYADELIANGVIVLDTNILTTKNRPLIQTVANMPLNDVLELVKAKKEERIIVPPCRVGDKVYRIFKDEKTITEERVGEMHLEFTIDNGTGWHNVWWLKEYNLGVTTFLTKEEAEKALEERKAANG